MCVSGWSENNFPGRGIVGQCCRQRGRRRWDGSFRSLFCFLPRQLYLRSAQVDFTRDNFQPLKRRGLDFFRQAAPAQKRAISAGAFDLFDAQPAGRVGLRIQIGEQNSFANSRETSSQIDGGSGFSHSALLVGDRDDLGWHAADLRRAMR